MPRASIDIGSNSMVLLVVDDTGNTIHDESAIVGLGRGLGDQGEFQIDRMEAAMAAFVRFADQCNILGVACDKIVGIATSASRRAANAQTFFEDVKSKTGINVVIVSGTIEAQLTWKGALLGLPIEQRRYAVVDLGGGSTEIVIGDLSSPELIEKRSVEIGTVRLTEGFFGANPDHYEADGLQAMRQHILEYLAAVDWQGVPTDVIAVAGTATTLGAMEKGLTRWNRDAVHGTRLHQRSLQSWIEKLAQSSAEERIEWAQVSPERAHYLLAGACVLESVCSMAKRNQLWVSDGGVRHGALMTELQNTQG